MLLFIGEEAETQRSIIVSLGFPNSLVAEWGSSLGLTIFRTHIIAPLLDEEAVQKLAKSKLGM